MQTQEISQKKSEFIITGVRQDQASRGGTA